MQSKRPVPQYCDACASPNIDFREVGSLREWRYCWICNVCGASTSCHNRTNVPLGIMATRRVRNLRTKAHVAFDPLWQSGIFTREKAYRWLARSLGIPEDSAHISWLTEEQLKTVIIQASAYYAENAHKAERKIKRRIQQHRKAIYDERAAIAKRKSAGPRPKQRRGAGSTGAAD